MVIDFHTHIFPTSFREGREEYALRDATFASLLSDPRSRMATAEELIAALDEAQVDAAVAMGIGWTDADMGRQANDYIIDAVAHYPDRLVGFCSVNPSWGEGAVEELERCAAAGLKGVGELHPDTQGFDLGGKEAMSAVMEAALQLGLPVLTHSSEPVGHLYPGKGNTTPGVLYAFVRNFPANTIVCAHWGGGLPFYALMPEVPSELDNVYYDTAASPFLYRPEIFSTVVGITGSERILFGTDFPLIRHRRLLGLVEDTAIGPEDRANILGRNARALLGI